MKAKLLFGLAAVLALGAAFAGCENFDDYEGGRGGGGGGGQSVYEPLVITGWFVDGSEILIEIRTERTVPRVVLTPADGDSYVLWVSGQQTSTGTIRVSGNSLIFYPYNNGASFSVHYNKGYPVTLYELPTRDGGLTNGESPGDGGAPPSRPPSDVTASTAAETVSAFGGSRYARVNANGSVTVNSDPPRITTNLTISGVSVVFESDVPMKLSIAPGKFLTITSDTNSSASIDVKGTSLQIDGGGTLELAEGSAMNVDDGGKVTLEGTIDVRGEMTLSENAELAVKDGDINIYNKFDVSNATMNVSSGNVNVHDKGILKVDANGMLNIDVNAGRAAISPVLNIYDGGVVDIIAASWAAQTYGVVFLHGSGKLLVSVSSQDELSKATKATGGVNTSGTITGGVEIQITQAFYDSATDYIWAGVDTANTVPITIKGLGSEADTSTPTLPVGFWIANDNITLKDVKLTVAVNTTNVVQTTFGGATYYGAIVIARSDDGTNPIVGKDNFPLGCSNVTVDNCRITVTAPTSKLIAGIYIYGDGYGGGENITINNNVIDVTSFETSGAQALAIHRWEPITITNNTLKARYQTARNGTPNGSPASAFYVNAMYADDEFDGTVISGNTFSTGVNIPEQYSFFINAWNAWDIWITEYQAAGAYTISMAQDLLDAKFGSYETTWYEATAGVHKQLYNALKADIGGNQNPGGNGFGAFLAPVYIDPTPRTGYIDWVLEAHEFKNGATTFVNYWGWDNSDYTNGKLASYPGTDKKSGFDPGGTRPVQPGGYQAASYKTVWTQTH